MSAYFVSVPQVFVGNTDNDSTKTNLFDPSIVAQYIRIIPVVCRKACTLRMELVGCELNGKQTKAASWAIRRFDWVVKSGKSHSTIASQKEGCGYDPELVYSLCGFSLEHAGQVNAQLNLQRLSANPPPGHNIL